MFDLSDKEEATRSLHALINRMRERRKPIIARWLDIHAAWKGEKTKTFFKSSTFNHYVPYFRRSVERFAKRAAQMVLPSVEYFEVLPTDTLGDEAGKRAESVHNYLLYLMRKRIRIYSLAKQWFRTFSLYGLAIAKSSISVRSRNVFPSVRAVDPFMFMYWPETVNNLDDSRIVVEDAYLPLEQYNNLAKRVGAEQIAQTSLSLPKWPDHISQRLNSSGLTEPSDVPHEQRKNDSSTWVYMSEVWLNQGGHWDMLWIVWNLKGSGVHGDERDPGIAPKIVHIAKTKYPRPQYRLATDREIPGEQDTSSLGSDQEWMQTLLNDQINMLMEGQAMSLGPPIALDPSFIGRADTLVYAPRKKWLVPPEGVKPITIPDTTKTGYQAVHFTMGLMDLFSGSSPLAEGQPIRNMPRAGFAVSSLLSMSLADIRDAARTVEDDILTPLLKDLHDLTVEFVPESQVMKIPGTDNLVQTYQKHDLEGNYDMTWIGSIQAQEQSERADKIYKLFQALGKNGELILADMQRQGYQMNWLALFKRLWRDGIGERGADSLIEKTPQPNEGGAPPPDALSALPPLSLDELRDQFATKISGGVDGLPS